MSTILLPNGVMVIEGDPNHAVWCANGLVHDQWFAEQLTQHISRGDVVVDVGANIGSLSRALLDAGAIVHAFEPNIEAMECLLHNCPELMYDDHLPAMKQSRAWLIALGDKPGWATLMRQAQAGASYVVSERGQIRVGILDDWHIGRVRLAKIDAEGWEAKILRGAEKTIRRCRPVIICEVNSYYLKRAGDSEEALYALLSDYGYKWRVMQPDLNFQSVQFDLLCEPK